MMMDRRPPSIPAPYLSLLAESGQAAENGDRSIFLQHRVFKNSTQPADSGIHRADSNDHFRMPRSGRIVIPHCPHHVCHRGHNRSALFNTVMDFKVYLGNLEELKSEYDCRIYSFCLMTNHVHLIIDPGSQADNLSLFMKRVAGRYTGYLNTRRARTGTAWNGRFRSNPIQTDSYLLTCSRYVELNPVRAGMVAHPGDYRWSSFRDRAGMHRLDWLDEDPIYTAMGPTRNQREAQYAKCVLESGKGVDYGPIRDAIKRGFPLGDDSFLHHAEETAGIRIVKRKRGRPQLPKK